MGEGQYYGMLLDGIEHSLKDLEKDMTKHLMLSDKKFMVGTMNGLKDFRKGKFRSWDEIKKELGL
jgi:hypothetical protein